MGAVATGPRGGETRWSARTWGALALLCGVLFLDGMDGSMVAVAIPSVRSDLGLSTSELQWIISSYILGFGGLLLLGGRAADLLGRRRVLTVGLAVFAVASLLGGLVSDPLLLIGTRFLKGASAAFTAPAGMACITTMFAEGPERNRALSFYGACGAMGFSSGLIFGGLLTEVGWRWTFLVPAPFAIAILVGALRLLPPDPPAGAAAGRRSFDLPGAVTATGAMLLLVHTVVTAPEEGWTSAATLLGAAGVLALLAAFVAIERRTSQPLVRLGILRAGHIRRAHLGGFLTCGCFTAFQFVAALYMQAVLGWSPLQTALAFLPLGIMVGVIAPRIGGLVGRVGTSAVMAFGFLCFSSAYLLFLRAGEAPSYVVDVLPTMLLLGGGFAMCFPAVNLQATAGVADREQGLASGLVNTSLQIGGAVVLAVATAVVGTVAPEAGDGVAFVARVHDAVAVIAGLACVGLVVAATAAMRRHGRRAPREATAEPVPALEAGRP